MWVPWDAGKQNIVFRATTFPIDFQALTPALLDPLRTGVSIGSQHIGIERLEQFFQANGTGKLDELDPRIAVSCFPGHATGAIRRMVGAKGPKCTVCAACAASSGAIGVAVEMIRAGRADVVIAGGGDTVPFSLTCGFSNLRAISSEPTAPFSEPSGINLGEGAGILIIESLEHALKRGAKPLAEILGYGLSGDAYHTTNICPKGTGIENVTREAMRVAGITAEDVEYVSTHGTGTDSNDVIESQVLLRIFGSELPVSSPKSFLGHTLGACGAIEIITTLLCQDAGIFPPTLNFKGRRPACADLDYVPNSARPGDFDVFISNNYGFGGSNGSIVVSRKVGEREIPVQPNLEVGISGFGGVASPGTDIASIMDAFWAGHTRGQTPDALDAFRMEGENAKTFSRMPPMIQYAVSAARQAIASVGTLPEDPFQTGVIAGVTVPPPRATERFLDSVFNGNPRFTSARDFPLTQINATVGQVSIGTQVKGYNTTMCGLSISAFIYAADLVRCGRQEAMIAVASDEKSPLMAELYQRAGKILAGSSPTIMAGDSLAEGAAAVIMEPVNAIRARGAEVLARITAVERGSAPKMHSGADQTQTVTDMLRTALTKADLQPGDIGGIFVTRHDEIAATKTVTAAISAVFGDDALPIASTDDLIGHCPASTDFFNIVAATESLRRGCMPARNAPTATRPVRHVVVFCHSMFNDIACIVLSGEAQ